MMTSEDYSLSTLQCQEVEALDTSAYSLINVLSVSGEAVPVLVDLCEYRVCDFIEALEDELGLSQNSVRFFFKDTELSPFDTSVLDEIGLYPNAVVKLGLHMNSGFKTAQKKVRSSKRKTRRSAKRAISSKHGEEEEQSISPTNLWWEFEWGL